MTSLKVCHRKLTILCATHRREEVFIEAGLSDEEYQPRVDGPAGFDIGGELPESIALSVIAKCHDAIFGPAYVGATAKQE